MSGKKEYIPKRKDNTINKEKGGGGLVFDILEGELFELNDTGFAIWNLCDGKKNVAEIEAALSSEYDLSGGDVNKVKEYIRELRGAGLLV